MITNLPDYYQTFYRNYDAALGRWIGVDPKGESAESMTGYQYAGNNPVMINDPMGDLFETYGIAKQHTGNEIARIENWEEEQQMGAGAGGAYAGGGSYFAYLATTGQLGGQTLYQAGDKNNMLSTEQLTDLVLSNKISIDFTTGKLSWDVQTPTINSSTGDVGVKLTTYTRSLNTEGEGQIFLQQVQ